MVDDLHGDASRFWLIKGSGGIAVKAFPSFLVDLCFESCFERFVRVAGSQEVGMTDKEAFFVVVGVDEPASNLIGVAGADITRLRMKYIDSVDVHLNLPTLYLVDVDVWLAEDDKQIACSGVLQRICHVEVGIHPGFEDGDAS